MRAQLSVELMAVLAAYFALIASFASFELQAGERMKQQAGETGAFLQARAACAVVGEFALDARNTVLDFSEMGENVTAAEGVITVGNQSAGCGTAVRSENGLRVAQNSRESV